MAGPNRTIIVIPGIMGSTLAYGSQGIWTDHIRENYRLLTRNPSLLRWTGRAADAQFWKTVHVMKGLPFLKMPLWRETLKYLEQNPTNRVIECPYDWRQSIRDSCRTVVTHVQSASGLTLEEPASASDSPLVVLTHSMGGLLFRVALALGLIHPTHIQLVVHMAPPFLGAPVAFRSLVDRTTLPFLNEYLWLTRFMNYPQFMEIMYDCFRTFPSMYELLPPEQIAFLHDDQYRKESPFVHTQFDAGLMAGATRTHQLLNVGDARLVGTPIKVFTIFSESNMNKATEMEYRVRTLGSNSYEILETYSSAFGDGTVLSNSARWSQVSKRLPLVGVNHAAMPNNKFAVQLLRSCGI